MVLKSDQERVMSLLKDTITLLCKNGLNFKTKFCVDAVIGVTVDEDELFYISVKEVVKSDKPEEQNSRLSNSEGSAEEGVKTEDSVHKRRRRKRRLKSEGKNSDAEGSKQFESGDDSPTNDATEADEQTEEHSSSKRACVKNEEEEDSDEDIMFIKQELDENSAWSQSQEMSGIAGDSSYQSFSDMPSDPQQDQNFPSLSDMTLLPVDGGAGPSGGWGASQQQRHYMARAPRTPTSLSASQLQQQPGDPMDPQQQTHPFSCSLCDMRYTTKGSLKRHENTHKGIFPHTCSYCNKGFLSNDCLLGHQYVHTGVKAFSCKTCGVKFQYALQKSHILKCRGLNKSSLNEK